MAVIVHSSDPSSLLRQLRIAIEEGKIQSWSRDSDGDFTHTPPQWSKKAWFRPKVASDTLIFRIFPPMKAVIGSKTYAVYHGRFIEMLLSHFDTQFDQAIATALPREGDKVKGT